MFSHGSDMINDIVTVKAFAEMLVMRHSTPHSAQTAQYLPGKQLWSLKINVELTYHFFIYPHSV